MSNMVDRNEYMRLYRAKKYMKEKVKYIREKEKVIQTLQIDITNKCETLRIGWILLDAEKKDFQKKVDLFDDGQRSIRVSEEIIQNKDSSSDKAFLQKVYAQRKKQREARNEELIP